MAKKKKAHLEPSPIDPPELGKPPKKKMVKKKAAKTPKAAATMATLSDGSEIPLDQLRCGYDPKPGELAAWKARAAATARFAAAAGATATATLPPRVDWRSNSYLQKSGNWTTDAKHQGNCGSCVAFAFTAVIESRVKIHCGDPSIQIDLSEMDIWSRVPGSCSTGSTPEDMARVCEIFGIAVEQDFRFTAGKPSPNSTIPKYIKTYRHIELDTRLKWQQTLADRGPFVATFDVTDTFRRYKKGDPVFRSRPTAFEKIEHHCIMVGGYDEGKQCWLIKNSWGPGWGDNGWCELGYGVLNIEALPALDISLDTLNFNKCPSRVITQSTCEADTEKLMDVLRAAEKSPELRAYLRYYVFRMGTNPGSLLTNMERVRLVQRIFTDCSYLTTWFRTNLLLMA